MSILSTKLYMFDQKVLTLPIGKRKKYNQKVGNLIESLETKLSKNLGLKVKNVEVSGSFAKHTILRKVNENPVDIDLVFYIANEQNKPKQKTMIKKIYKTLKEQYPNKKVEDFEIHKKATTVKFRGSGLFIDVVPVFEIKRKPGVGFQYDSNGTDFIKTSPRCQVQFVLTRYNKDPDFRILVRLAKKWRDASKLKPLKSYTIELIMAHLIDKDKFRGNIDQKFLRFLEYLSKTKLCEKISFSGNQNGNIKFKEPVVIVDPSCNTNNVASNITDKNLIWIANEASRATKLFKSVMAKFDYAQLKKIFGPEFNKNSVRK